MLLLGHLGRLLTQLSDLLVKLLAHVPHAVLLDRLSLEQRLDQALKVRVLCERRRYI